MMAIAPTIVVPVILAGGSGTRLWPLSRALHPKQFISVGNEGDETTLFQHAALRVAGLADSHIEVRAPCVVANEAHRFTIVEQLGEIGLGARQILLEPSGRNTAPALTLAALAARDGSAGDDPVLVATPADHAIGEPSAFSAALRRAVAKAAGGSIVVVGIRPDRADTGFGYIRTGLGEAGGIDRVEAFVEKPDLATAERYVADGGYWWNGGIFVLRASVWLEALQRFRPEIATASAAAWATAAVDDVFLRFDDTTFAAIPAESIDYAVMEPASRDGGDIDVRMVKLDAGWSDLGAWDAVWRAGRHDAKGNSIHGDVLVHDSRNTFVHAGSRLVGVIGLDDITVVETADAVLVAHRSKSSAVKDMAGVLADAGRSEASAHRRVHRPWGWYERVDQGPGFQVKRILVKPGARLSLQMHRHRAEHWIVVSGRAEVTNGSKVSQLGENQSTYIPLGQTHRLANPGEVPLEIIEVQSGSYLGEDDIVRFEDNYGRS